MRFLIFLSLLAFLQSSRGYSDILVGSMDPSEGITISSQTPSGLFGSPLRNAGDFNGDGFADVIAASSTANNNAGIAYVIFGSANGLSNFDVSSGMTASQGIIISTGNFGDQLGGSVGYAGDVNGDGIDDILIGAKGIVYVIYGSKTLPEKIDLAGGLNQNQGFTVLENNSQEMFGASVSSAGDVNNDKIDDLLIGAYGTGNTKGSCYVIFGKKGPRSQVNLALGLNSNEGFVIIGPPMAKSYFGWSASNAGDIDGDGIGDIIIGAYGITTVYIIYGKESNFGTIDLTSGLSPSEGFSLTGKSTTSQFGYSVRGAGDFNGDSYEDVIIGAHGEDSFKGAAYVIFGKERNSLLNIDLSSELDPSRGVKIAGKTDLEILGMSVSGAGDVNNDGIDDVIVGVPRGSGTAGTAYVIFGSKTFPLEIVPGNGLAPSKGFSIIGISPSDFLGFSVSCAGDMNGDGMDDVIVGANGVDTSAGAAYLLFSELVCPEKCETCETGKKCLTCKDGFGLLDFICLEKCPVGTELVNGICTISSKPATPIGKAAEVSKGMFDSGSTASRIFTMGRSLSVGLGLIAKIIQNVRFLNINYPEETIEVFETYGTDLFELPIPETFYQSPDTKELSSQYARYDMEPSFLENYWDTIMTILISLGCFLLIKLLQIVTKSQDKESLFQVALKNIGQTAANFLIIQIYSNLDDVIFFLILDISSTKMNSSSAGISLGMGVFFLLLGLFLVIFHCWLLGRYQKEKNEGNLERFEKKFKIFGTLFEDFKDDCAAKQSFFWILIFRCIVLVLITMLLQPPYMQAILLMLTNLIFLGYFIYYRPFKSLFDEISQYFCELTIFAAYLGVLILSVLDAQNIEKSGLRNGLGKCIVLTGIVLALGGFIIQMIQTIGAIIAIGKFVRNYCKKDKQVSVLDQSQNVSGISESTGILNNTSLVHLNDKIKLMSTSRKNKRIPLEKLKCTMENDLEISSINHNENKKLVEKIGHRVNLPKEEEESKEVVADKIKIQVWTRPMGSRIYREGGGSSYVGLTQINNYSVRRKKIKRNAILPNLPRNDDV